MGKIFIAHAWSNNKDYNQKQLDFIRKLELELNDKDLEVTYDDNDVDKIGLNSFMRENIKNCDVILAICDDIYFQKSDKENTGVYFELKEITEDTTRRTDQWMLWFVGPLTQCMILPLLLFQRRR